MGGVLNDATLVVFLFLGAGASLLLKLWVPNTRRRLRMKEQLELLGRQIADVSGRVGARPTVMLRVQQKRLQDMMNPKVPGGRYLISPDFEDVAKQCETATLRLSKQLELIRSLDHSAARLECLMGEPLPPSALDKIESGIKRIVNLATTLEADDENLRSLEADVAEVAMHVDQMEQSNTAFRQFVQTRLKDLAAFYEKLLPQAAGAVQGGSVVAPVLPPLAAAAQRLRQDLPEVFKSLDMKVVPEDISFDALADLDSDLFKLNLLRRYLELNPDLTQAKPANTEDQAEPVNTPADVYCELLGYLRLRSWDAISAARILISEAEQGIYRDEVKAALTDCLVDIWFDRQVIRPNTPVEFALRFGRDSFNQAAAREGFRCLWEFEHPPDMPRGILRRARAAIRKTPPAPPDARRMTLPQHCWQICQYFPVPGTYKVRVKFQDWIGKPIDSPKPAEKEFTVEKRLWDKAGPRLRLELVSMGLALAPALFALLTAAQDQVARVSWSTALGGVFALGFGVDTLKNLLVSRQP
jgi:hypothetical protein